MTWAAKAAGMNRSSAQRLRLRLAGTAFDQHWDQAIALYHRKLADPFTDAAPHGRRPVAPHPR